MCSIMCLPFCRTTQSRRRRHSPMLLLMNNCGSFCHALTITCFNSSVRWNFDDGRPSADGHPRWHNQLGSNPVSSVATCLAQWTAHSHASSNTSCFWSRGKAHCPAAASTCNSTSCSDVRQQTLAKDLVTVVLAVYLCACFNENDFSARLVCCDRHTTLRRKCYVYCRSLDGATLFTASL